MDGENTDRPKIVSSGPRRYKICTWIVFTVLILLLVGSGAIGYFGWTIGDADVPTSGYVAMAFGVIFSLAFGIGLMVPVILFTAAAKDMTNLPCS